MLIQDELNTELRTRLPVRRVINQLFIMYLETAIALPSLPAWLACSLSVQNQNKEWPRQISEDIFLKKPEKEYVYPPTKNKYGSSII